MSFWFADGARVDSLPLDDRAVQYGDGLFETIAIRSGAPRFLELHLQRLELGCKRLGLSAPSAKDVTRQLAAAVSQCGIDIDFAVAKILVSSGAGRRGYRRPASVGLAIRIGVFPATPVAPASYRDGVSVDICSIRLAIQPRLAGIKTLSRLEQVLASSEPREPEVFEGLMMDTEERLVCGTMSNVFVVNDNQVTTPAITRCGVAGVMRQHILSLLDRGTIGCSVIDIEAERLDNASEVFLTNSQFGVLPVRRIAGRALDVGRVTRSIMSQAATSGVIECAL
jgi:4-amino-4-deoxychorismate lyase